MICRKACFKGWTHDEIVAGNVAEVEWKSSPEMLQATLRATVSEAATRCNYAIARNVTCNVASCGRALIGFREVCKRDMLATALPADNWKLLAEDRVKWQSTCSQLLRAGERKLKAEADVKRAKIKATARVAASAESGYICGGCGRVYRPRIGLVSHQRKCSQVR